MKISIKMLPPRSTFVENKCTTQQKLDTAQKGPFQAKWLDINIFIFILYLSAVFFPSVPPVSSNICLSSM